MTRRALPRRQISIRGETHARVLAHCREVGCTPGDYVELLIAQDFGVRLRTKSSWNNRPAPRLRRDLLRDQEGAA